MSGRWELVWCWLVRGTWGWPPFSPRTQPFLEGLFSLSYSFMPNTWHITGICVLEMLISTTTLICLMLTLRPESAKSTTNIASRGPQPKWPTSSPRCLILLHLRQSISWRRRLTEYFQTVFVWPSSGIFSSSSLFLCGTNDQPFPQHSALHEFQNLHAANKEKIHDFVRGHFYG